MRQQEIDQASDEFFSTVLRKLEADLADKEYLCGETLSAVDVVIYNEITTVIYLQNHELGSSEYPNLVPWLERVSEVPQVDQATEHLNEYIKHLEME